MKTISLALLALAAAVSANAALPSVGPNYVRPPVDSPAAYSAAHDLGSWKTATPADAFSRGDWWTLFADRTLNDLEARALAANQDLQAAAARVEQARAAAGFARGTYWPQIAANGSVVRERTSSTTDNSLPNGLTTTYRAPLEAVWELDLFGRVRRLSESARAEAAASGATFESVRLTLAAEVASSYFSLRAVDEELNLLRATVGLRERGFELFTARLKNGTTTELDLARAETELATAQAELAALLNRRAALQNALAVLLGEPAGNFACVPLAATSPGEESSLTRAAVSAPLVPPGLPSELLERRPDIAAAERLLAAANARIGVARAAFFPAISLTGSGGFASADVNRLFQADSRVWSIGPSLYLPIFQGGRNRANLQRSQAAYNEAVATFRQSVLIAFREVEDSLSSIRYLREQSTAQERALTSARRAAQLSQTRYDAGYVNYLDVIDAERTSLNTQRANAQLAALRLNATIALIKALGGGWKTLPESPALAQVSQ